MAAFTNYDNSGFYALANSLSGLGQTFGKALEQQGKLATAQNIGQKYTAGDYTGAAQAAFDAGDLNTGLTLAKSADEQKWLSQLAPQLYGNGASLSPLATTAQPGAPTQPGQPLDLPSSGASRGDRNNNFGNMNDGKFTQSQPGYVGSDGRFAQFDTPQHGFNAQAALLDNYGRQGVNTVAGIVSKWAPAGENGAQSTANYIATVSRDLGVSPNTPLDLADPNLRATVARSMAGVELGHKFEIPVGAIGGYPGGQQPAQVAGANPAQTANPGVATDAASSTSATTAPAPASGQAMPFGARNWKEAVIRANQLMTNPGFSRAPESFQTQVKNAAAQAQRMLEIENSEANLPANRMKAEANVRRQQGVAAGLTGPELDAFAATGNPGGLQTPFSKGMSEASAKRWSGLIEEGDKARNASGDIEQLAELNRRMGPSNDLAGLRGFVADTFGVGIGKDITDIQVFSSLIDKLTPQMRVPGSGSSSDLDVKGMKASLPNLMKTPEGRAQIIKQMQGLNQYSIDRATIAEKLDNQEISQPQAAKLLRNLRASEYVKTGSRPDSVATIFADEPALPRNNPTPETSPMVHRRDQQPPASQSAQGQNGQTQNTLRPLPASELARARQAIGSGQKTYAEVKQWLESNHFSAEGL